ncbi:MULTISPECIES: ribonuclease E inhibitor RraB [Xanthomonas]|uniref:ribonuclease E inhibitor RraB n=1 Tax=Xanthomonas TaxID=338 RepID=UPI000E1E3C2B|nr:MULTISPECIES: ribonuclease E inhibitor RraB [Xanthomonas]
MNFPRDENGDVLRRMQASNFDFSKKHDVEFFAVFRTEEAAYYVAMEFVADRKAGEHFVNIETRPADSGGMELELVKRMIVTHDAVTEFEERLASRVSRHDGYMDGWGVLQQ